MNDQTSHTHQEYLDRKTFLRILEISLQTKSYRFLRQSSEYWLSQYPGDLLVSLWQSRGLFAEGKREEAIAQLEALLSIDPEFLEAYQLLAFTLSGNITERYLELMASIHALGGRVRASVSLPEWSGKLLETRQAIARNDVDGTMQAMSQVLGRGARIPLIDVTHIRSATLSQDKMTIKQLAEVYYSRWQNGLQFILYMADSKLELGDEAGAIEMLHKCASMDTAGQVVERLWGENHPYRPLWLASMQVPFDIPIPAQVAAQMGRNQLASNAYSLSLVSEEVPLQTLEEKFVENRSEEPPKALEINDNAVDSNKVANRAKEQNIPPQVEKTESKDIPSIQEKKHKDVPANNIEIIFDRIAQKLKQPKLGNIDGRFPTYVILSSKTALMKKYGPQTFTVLDAEMKSLSKSIKSRHGWDSIVFYPDDPVCTALYNLNSIENNDPWKIKLLLSDLDNALGKKGAMIGALLIVGGPDIVPFHRLPNPAGDLDVDVPSDNPYSTFSSNYFVPEFPVGRLPDEAGDDAGLLLDQLRRISLTYRPKQKKQATIWRNVFSSAGFLVELVLSLLKKKQQSSVLSHSLGYTAAIWQRSSIAVFRPLGQAQRMRVSPPEDVESIRPEAITGSILEYFNLHGIENGPEWYGQRDVTGTQAGPDYPVALHPDLIHKNGRAPQNIFSEACFGGNVYQKTYSNAISLKFISIGAEVIVASTCTAYGSVSTPLIAADLLGYLYWKYLTDGFSAGEAMLFAKIEFAKEMNRRQGYLDGEDQKTLLSFVLYGDPLAICKGLNAVNMKGSHRQRKSLDYNVMSENKPEAKPTRVTEETLSEMKAMLSPYLPGLVDEDINFLRQNVTTYEFTSLPEKPEKISKSMQKTGNIVMSVKKEYRIAQQIHRHYARVTVNKNGKLMKVAISR